MSIDNSIQMS